MQQSRTLSRLAVPSRRPAQAAHGKGANSCEFCVQGHDPVIVVLTCTTALCSGVTLWLSGTFSGSQREREMGVVQYLIIQCSGPHPVKSSAHLHGGLVQRRHLVAVWGVHISAGCKQGRGDLVASLHVPYQFLPPVWLYVSTTTWCSCLPARLHQWCAKLHQRSLLSSYSYKGGCSSTTVPPKRFTQMYRPSSAPATTILARCV